MKVEPALKAILIACSIRPAGALCSIWALCHVRTECASRALAPAPGATLAEELDCSERCGPEVHSLLQELQQARLGGASLLLIRPVVLMVPAARLCLYILDT
jgi:hypothetical protein